MELSDDELFEHTVKINNMSHLELARLWRFAKPGHLYFSNPELIKIFNTRFKSLGGFTTEIFKQL